MSQPKPPEPPIGIVASLAAGFEAVNQRPTLILLPLGLDVFLWLGPHLSGRRLMERFLDQVFNLQRLPGAVDASTAAAFRAMRAALMQYGESHNLFAALSTAPLGLPSLSASLSPITAPTGRPLFWLIDHPLGYLLLVGIFSVLGLFLGAVYFGGIAQQVRDAQVSWVRLFTQVWGDWVRLTLFAGFMLGVLIALFVPLIALSALITLFSPIAGTFFSALSSAMALWVVLYAALTVQGIVLQRRGLFGALWDSVRLVHVTLNPTAILYTMIFLITLGLGEVWALAPADSWFLLLGLVGHAVVSTALVAATFAYYQDRYRWWVEARQHAERTKPAVTKA